MIGELVTLTFSYRRTTDLPFDPLKLDWEAAMLKAFPGFRPDQGAKVRARGISKRCVRLFILAMTNLNAAQRRWGSILDLDDEVQVNVLSSQAVSGSQMIETIDRIDDPNGIWAFMPQRVPQPEVPTVITDEMRELRQRADKEVADLLGDRFHQIHPRLKQQLWFIAKGLADPSEPNTLHAKGALVTIINRVLDEVDFVPVNEMVTTMGLDYDGTFTRNPKLWLHMVRQWKRARCKVYVVTMRYPSERTNHVEPMNEELLSLVDGVCFTGNPVTKRREAKEPYMVARGIHVDIWVDDNPMAIHKSAFEVWGHEYPEGHVTVPERPETHPLHNQFETDPPAE